MTPAQLHWLGRVQKRANDPKAAPRPLGSQRDLEAFMK
jgi:hypothetical protein